MANNIGFLCYFFHLYYDLNSTNSVRLSKFIKKNFFSFSVELNSKANKCLNRGDQGAKLFNAKITSQRSQGTIRKNLRQMIPNNDTHVLCDFNTKLQSYQQAYKLSDLCKTTSTHEIAQELPCLLKNGETVNL